VFTESNVGKPYLIRCAGNKILLLVALSSSIACLSFNPQRDNSSLFPPNSTIFLLYSSEANDGYLYFLSVIGLKSAFSLSERLSAPSSFSSNLFMSLILSELFFNTAERSLISDSKSVKKKFYP
jgi:hypothetical protein